jgi:predicted N-acyltransferase
VDKRVLLKHTGSYVFDYAAQDTLYNSLKDMYQAKEVDVPAGPVVEPRVLATNQAPVAKKAAAKASSKKKK